MADTRGFEDSKDGGVGHYNLGANKKNGPYIATVKYTADPLRMGRLGVNIPALSNTVVHYKTVSLCPVCKYFCIL